MALPDICGSIDDPNEQNVNIRYGDWFKKYLSDEYNQVLTADGCYYLRCACLHEGKNVHRNFPFDRVIFVPSLPSRRVHLGTTKNSKGTTILLEVNIFCEDICNTVEQWVKDIENDPLKQQSLKEFIKIDFEHKGIITITESGRGVFFST